MKYIYSLLTIILLFISAPASAQVIVTAAGNGTGGYSGDGHPATQAELNQPYGVALDDSGNLYICDAPNRRIRKVSPAYGGIITTIAGNGTPGYTGDHNLGTNAQIDGSYFIAVDHHGNVYIDDGNNIRKISPSDTITTIAGTGVAGYNGDGILATTAQLNQPAGIAIDSDGNIYFVDTYNYRIRKIDTSGIITTIAGYGIAGFSSDGSLADTANFSLLGSIAVDKRGNLFFEDNVRIRKIDSARIITTIAGNGIIGYSGDNGLGTAAEIGGGAIAIDNAGNLFIADEGANHIREVNTEGIIYTVAGSTVGYGGDNGDPLLAKLNAPQGVAVNDSGDVYIGDVGNNRIRLVTMHHVSVNTIVTAKQGINISPNPCHSQCLVQVTTAINEQAEVIVNNISGTEVYRDIKQTNHSFIINTDWPPGVYFITVITKQDVFTQKIIIQ